MTFKRFFKRKVAIWSLTAPRARCTRRSDVPSVSTPSERERSRRPVPEAWLSTEMSTSRARLVAVRGRNRRFRGTSLTGTGKRPRMMWVFRSHHEGALP